MIKGIKSYLHNKSWQTFFFEISTYLFVGTLPLLLKINTIALWVFILGSLILCVKNNDWRVNLKSKKRILWILFALLSLYFIGLFSSKDFSAIIKQIIKTLPLLIVPLFVLSHNKGDFNLKNIYISLGIGLFVGMLICWYNILISIMSKEKYTEQAKYFFEWIYTDWNLVAPLDGHPSYFAILIVLFLCALIMNENFKKLRRNRLKLALIIFPYFLFLIETSSRIGVISLIIILLFYSIKKFNYKRLLGMIVLLSIVILFSIKFDYLGSKFTKVVSMDGEIKIERYHRWKEIIKVFKAENNWLLGVGPSDARKIYKSAYDNGNFDLAFNNNYNAHNQYLEFFISNGIVGFLVYLTVLGLFLFETRLKKEALNFFIVIVLFSMTESVFGRSQGVLIFAFFYSFLILYYQPKIEK
tara:strand:- start:1849 stop:3087 length:1239 start_codon:yes stop_codon:yes gene_type:complete